MADATAPWRLKALRCSESYVCRAKKRLTYDQGREMTRYAEITQKTGTAIYFCDRHNSWQRVSNENINSLTRQYLPEGTDLSGRTQGPLDAITYEINIRPRKCFNYRCPIKVMIDIVLL